MDGRFVPTTAMLPPAGLHPEYGSYNSSSYNNYCDYNKHNKNNSSSDPGSRTKAFSTAHTAPSTPTRAPSGRCLLDLLSHAASTVTAESPVSTTTTTTAPPPPKTPPAAGATGYQTPPMVSAAPSPTLSSPRQPPRVLAVFPRISSEASAFSIPMPPGMEITLGHDHSDAGARSVQQQQQQQQHLADTNPHLARRDNDSSSGARCAASAAARSKTGARGTKTSSSNRYRMRYRSISMTRWEAHRYIEELVRGSPPKNTKCTNHHHPLPRAYGCPGGSGSFREGAAAAATIARQGTKLGRFPSDPALTTRTYAIRYCKMPTSVLSNLY